MASLISNSLVSLTINLHLNFNGNRDEVLPAKDQPIPRSELSVLGENRTQLIERAVTAALLQCEQEFEFTLDALEDMLLDSDDPPDHVLRRFVDLVVEQVSS